MDQQQPHELPVFAAAGIPPSGPATDTPVVVKPQHQLGAVEEFLIGCASGVSGAALSWLELSGLEWLFYSVLVPCLLLEVWESWVLFQNANAKTRDDYNAVVAKTAARKRLARQLYGQGVIMGRAGLDLMGDEMSAPAALLPTITFYAVAWLSWIVICHMLDSTPPQDKITVQAKKQRQVARQNSKKMLHRTMSSSSSSKKRLHRTMSSSTSSGTRRCSQSFRRSSTTSSSIRIPIRRCSSSSSSRRSTVSVNLP